MTPKQCAITGFRTLYPPNKSKEQQRIRILHFVDRASCNDSWKMTNVMHKFFSMCLFLFITLYMFRAHRAHNQERQIVSIQPLVTVILKIGE